MEYWRLDMRMRWLWAALLLNVACGSDATIGSVDAIAEGPADALVGETGGTADLLELGLAAVDLEVSEGDGGDVGELPPELACTEEECAVLVPSGSCLAWACDVKTGCVEVPLTGAACDDGNPCTQGDQCLAGACVSQNALCDDQNACTEDSCLEDGSCTYLPVMGVPCDDDNACTIDDSCEAEGCVGEPAVCNDDDPCTLDTCDVQEGCVTQPLYGNPCDDGSACTTSDHCQDGSCSGTPVPCEDGNPCTQDVCDPIAGCLFIPGTGAPCDDGSECTDVDSCLEGLCVGQAASCGDGNPCTLDSCSPDGGCIHTEPPGLPCDDGDACTVGEKCYQGECQPGQPLECDDKSACTSEYCDAGAGCIFTVLPDVACDDGNACTFADSCVDGGCVGQPVDCDDGSTCTADSCDALSGCSNTPLETLCDDGDPCTAGDFCAAGACVPGGNPQCLAVERVVLAGDSWSAGLIMPLREALDGRGYEEVVLTFELTTKPGSQVSGWVSDANLMNALYLSLDMEPKAEILFFTLSGNDFLYACKKGLGLLGPLGFLQAMQQIQNDLAEFVNLARAGRPHLRIVIVGYDYLHFEMIQALGNTMPGLNLVTFNLGLVDLAARGRDVAAAIPGVYYAHNMGLLQYTYGDYFHPPFLCPNPIGGCPEYAPGAVPKPGPALGFDPFPGGWFTTPSPIDYLPDGVHPSFAGFRTIIENSLDQGPAVWIEDGW